MSSVISMVQTLFTSTMAGDEEQGSWDCCLRTSSAAWAMKCWRNATALDESIGQEWSAKRKSDSQGFHRSIDPTVSEIAGLLFVLVIVSASSCPAGSLGAPCADHRLAPRDFTRLWSLVRESQSALCQTPSASIQCIGNPEKANGRMASFGWEWWLPLGTMELWVQRAVHSNGVVPSLMEGFRRLLGLGFQICLISKKRSYLYQD